MKLKLTTALGTVLLAAAPAFADKAAVLDNYADIALAKYTDSLTTAQMLLASVNTLTDAPSAEALQAAKDAWLAARVPYQQTEVYRFGNAIVDDWEGKVNAWPLDEGLIDYVDAAYGGATDENEYAVLNVVANASLCPATPLTHLTSRPTCSKGRCTRQTAWKAMSRPVITPWNSCSGARI